MMFRFSLFTSISSPMFFFGAVKKFLVSGGKLFFFAISLKLGSLFTFTNFNYLGP